MYESVCTNKTCEKNLTENIEIVLFRVRVREKERKPTLCVVCPKNLMNRIFYPVDYASEILLKENT